MSFSGEMKEEIARLIPEKEEEVRAELMAIIRFCGRILRQEESVAVFMETENVVLAKTYVKLIKRAFDLQVQLEIRRHGTGKYNQYFILLSERPEDMLYSEERPERQKLQQALQAICMWSAQADPRGFLKTPGSMRAYIRGAFLCTGSMSDPGKSYHFEMVCEDEQTAQILKELMAGFFVHAKVILRKQRYIVYLKDSEEIIQILYIAEQYLGKTLSPTESQKLLFFYDGLGLSADLIEYLLEYCVSHNHKSIRYIEKVAIAWAEEGITTVEQAKRSNSRYNKEYFTILKALGITNRNPVETEITLMDTWLKTYCFSMEIIQEACNRTVLQTGQASFQYTDKILEGWKKKEVKTLDDIRSLDDEHQKRRQSKKAASRKPAAPASNNRFNNFEQREYDFSEYEKHLLNQ